MDKNTLEYRVRCFIILEFNGYFSMVMAMSMREGLSRAYNLPMKEINKIYDIERSTIDIEVSNVTFEIEIISNDKG